MRIGDLAPDFSLIDHDGITRQLSTALADGPIVLFFYPAAMTPGCTKEACHFRDTGAEFTALGAQRWGISMDDSCLLYTSPSPRDRQKSRMPSSA